jgi:hypothetical protein
MYFIDFIWYLVDNLSTIVSTKLLNDSVRHIKGVCPTIYFKLIPTDYENTTF